MKIINSLKEKTILIIAHRVNTLKDCDKVYELNNGRLSEKSYEEIKQDNKNN
jgi:ABC-type multidrug transport system fused ATPase/permease subunit